MKLHSQGFATATVIAAALLGAAPSAPAQEQGDAALGKQLVNPIAELISVPFQFNYDEKIGPKNDGTKSYLNLQPVVPISINKDWNVISRTILPVVRQEEIFPGAGTQSGIGDIVQSFFFSPKAPTSDGWIWGAGPVLLLPTGSDDMLSGRKWGLGPTAVALKQEHGYTYGMLVNHIWSVAGESGRAPISATFLQPFFGYTTKDAWTFVLNSESTYDWKAGQWSAPINLYTQKVVRIGKQPVSLGGGVRYWATAPDSGPNGWGYRLIVTFPFPK